MFPFFAVDPSSLKQRFLKMAAACPLLLGLAAGLIGCLPISLQRWVVSRYTKNLDPHAFEATLALFRRQTATNAFYLAQHEFRDLAAPADWWLLEHFGMPGNLMEPTTSYALSSSTSAMWGLTLCCGSWAGKRMIVFCAPSDMWFPDYQVKEMLAKVPNIQVRDASNTMQPLLP